MRKSLIVVTGLVLLVLMLNWLSGCGNELQKAVNVGEAVVLTYKDECQCDKYDDLLAKIAIFQAMLKEELPPETIDKILVIADELCEQFDEPEIRLHIRVVVALLEGMRDGS